jgi:hypothetical protein
MTQKKLKLESLEVQSFITNLDNEEKRNIKGGTFPSAAPTWCGGPTICDDTFIWRCTGYYCPDDVEPTDPVEPGDPAEPNPIG